MSEMPAKQGFLARYCLRLEAFLLLIQAIWRVRNKSWSSLRQQLRSVPGRQDEVLAESIDRAVMFAEHYMPITGICLAVTMTKTSMYRRRGLQCKVSIDAPRHGVGHIFTSRE